MSAGNRLLDAAGEGPALEPSPGAGAVATSHPLAVEAGLQILRAGGNAVDAAVGAALVLGVVDPMSAGIGGDCFALTWREGAGAASTDHGAPVPRAIDGSGRAPAAATVEALRRAGHQTVPQEGIFSVTVPGALDAFDRLLAEEGTWSLGRVLEPAIRIATDGFLVTRVVARDWHAAQARLRVGHHTDAWLVDGRAPRAGERFCQPALAATLAQIARHGAAVFYRGELAAAIERTSRELGGFLRASDLEAHASEWVEPLEGSYRGHPVFELPPAGQGLVVLQALGIMEGFPLADVDEEERLHVTIEAVKLAFADGLHHLGDPRHLRVPVASLLTDAYLETRRALVTDRALEAPAPGMPGADTVYVATVDGRGGACSLIHSIFHHFGSNVVVPGTGITLQSRGALFRLEEGHPCALGPSRRPYHTIIPAMVFREGRPWLVLGVVGGFQQPQAQAQILSRLIDLGAEPSQAVAAPRFRWIDGARVRLEEGFSPPLREGLARRGHALTDDARHGGFGGAQLLRLDRGTGRVDGASDPRKDGRVGRTDEA